MNRLTFLLVQLLLIVRCARADDVGLDYDAADQKAWEKDYGDYPYRSYESSDLTPPAVAAKTDSPQCHDGLYTFITPRGTAVNDSRGMVILDDEGELVWMQKTSGQPYNFNVQYYQGEPHLTFWMGNDGVGGHGEGEYYLLNSSYQEVAKISALKNSRADLHTLTLTEDGTAIISIYEQSKKDGLWIWDCLFQEIDIATNTLVFEWRASDHHSLGESFHTRGHEGATSHSDWDWFHLNSVEKDKHGNYLVSARYTHSLSYVNGQTGDIIWILGGQRNMFQSDDGATDFSSQHYARFHKADDFPQLVGTTAEEKDGLTTQLISLFDNRRDDRWDTKTPSRGLLLEVTYSSVTASNTNTHNTHKARIVKEYLHPDSLSAESQGSFQVVPAASPGQDPSIVLGWGARPVFSTFTASGDMICDTHFGTDNALHAGSVQSYRALRYPWVGRPTTTSPNAVFHSTRNSIFVSWNGATEISSWALQHTDAHGDDDSADWVVVSITQRKGFETEIAVGACVTRYLRVVALDAEDKVIGVSNSMELAFQADFACEEMNNISFISTDGTAFYMAGITITPVGLVMVTMCATMFLIICFECWRGVQTWRRRRDFAYYKVEVDPYL